MLVIEKPLMGLKTSARAPWAFLRVARCFSAVSDARVTPAFRKGLNFAANFKARDYNGSVEATGTLTAFQAAHAH